MPYSRKSQKSREFLEEDKHYGSMHSRSMPAVLENIIAQCNQRSEGQTAKQWLDAHGICEQTYYRWQRLIRWEIQEDILKECWQIRFTGRGKTGRTARKTGYGCPVLRWADLGR